MKLIYSCLNPFIWLRNRKFILKSRQFSKTSKTPLGNYLRQFFGSSLDIMRNMIFPLRLRQQSLYAILAHLRQLFFLKLRTGHYEKSNLPHRIYLYPKILCTTMSLTPFIICNSELFDSYIQLISAS